MTYVPAAASLGVTIFAIVSLHNAPTRSTRLSLLRTPFLRERVRQPRKNVLEQVEVIKKGGKPADKKAAEKKLPEARWSFSVTRRSCARTPSPDVPSVRPRRRSVDYCNNISEDLLNSVPAL